MLPDSVHYLLKTDVATRMETDCAQQVHCATLDRPRYEKYVLRHKHTLEHQGGRQVQRGCRREWHGEIVEGSYRAKRQCLSDGPNKGSKYAQECNRAKAGRYYPRVGRDVATYAGIVSASLSSVAFLCVLGALVGTVAEALTLGPIRAFDNFTVPFASAAALYLATPLML